DPSRRRAPARRATLAKHAGVGAGPRPPRCRPAHRRDRARAGGGTTTVNATLVGAIPQRVHLIGVGGVHMSGIAQILRHRGHTVSGSDLLLSLLTSRLETLGVTVHKGHVVANIDEAELVVYTSAAQEDNPVLTEARSRGIDTIKRAPMIARLM